MAHPGSPSGPQPGPLDTLYLRFSALRQVGQNPMAQLYSGADASGAPVTVVVLREQAAADPALRAAFAAAVSHNSFAQQPGDVPVHAADLASTRPWAATYARSGQAGAERLLAGLPGGPVVPVPAAYTPPPVQPAPAGMSTGARAALIAAGVVLLMAAAVGVFYLGGSLAGGKPQAERSTPPVVKPSHGTGAPVPPPATGSGGTGSPGRPVLRNVSPVTVVGPSFAAGEETYTMRFDGWPFAFRTPGSWGCLGGKTTIPNAKAWVCVDERNTDAKQKVNVLLRPCPTTCTAAEQVAMNRVWLDEPEKAEVLRQRTYYVETRTNGEGMYTVDGSHFFSGSEDPADRALRWQVGVFIKSPPETRDVVQKILNDIVTQAG
ncbi:hypothetical protein [Rhizomonospora bruguierae]|uniref:hypothetical protein n=1 Tax=Rhizomonospora bruguierae TaxID=1581705 RepID=UPI001BCCAA75|nr:hypothetical protein [Micromonospora sp. NBRC 107566]